MSHTHCKDEGRISAHIYPHIKSFYHSQSDAKDGDGERESKEGKGEQSVLFCSVLSDNKDDRCTARKLARGGGEGNKVVE